MFSFKRKLVNTNEAKQLQHFLKNKNGKYKEITKAILEGIEVFYIVADGKGINDYEVIKLEKDYSTILILTYAEYEELTSKKPLQRIIYSKKVFDLR